MGRRPFEGSLPDELDRNGHRRDVRLDAHRSMEQERTGDAEASLRVRPPREGNPPVDVKGLPAADQALFLLESLFQQDIQPDVGSEIRSDVRGRLAHAVSS